MNTYLTIGVFIALIALIPESDAIKCNACKNANQNDCEASDKYEKQTSDCSGANVKFCKKIVFGGKVTRECAGSDEKASEGCYKNKDDYMCYCTGDHCNPAPAQAPALALILTAGVFSLIFFK